MNQVLHAQLAPITLIDKYRWQQSFEQSEPHYASIRGSRNRGVFLSHQGWQKLIQAGVLSTKLGERYTYEQLSERSHLDERTISRMLSCEVKVDKSTLKAFFRAFNVSLEAGDFTASRSNETKGTTSKDSSTCTTLAIQRNEFERIMEELAQLKQRLKEYDRLFQRLGLNESPVGRRIGA
jgi:transcriptional regulator with XRE-family HTH domain